MARHAVNTIWQWPSSKPAIRNAGAGLSKRQKMDPNLPEAQVPRQAFGIPQSGRGNPPPGGRSRHCQSVFDNPTGQPQAGIAI